MRPQGPFKRPGTPPPRSLLALGSTMTNKGCRQQVLFYWASKALNTEMGRAGKGADVDTLAFENGNNHIINSWTESW